MLNGNNEIWLPIEDYENIYWVSNKGRVKNNRKVMKYYTNNSGYQCIDLTVNKVKKKFLVHRLVASHFIDNTYALLEVNHIDENKDNNCVENLEWCTRSYNLKHSAANGAYNTRPTLGKKHKIACSSKYHNVTWDKNRERWQASIRQGGKTWYQKRFKTEVEAALHVNWIIETLGLTDRPKNIIS